MKCCFCLYFLNSCCRITERVRHIFGACTSETCAALSINNKMNSRTIDFGLGCTGNPYQVRINIQNKQSYFENDIESYMGLL